VVAVNPGGLDSHHAWEEKCGGFPFPLCHDEGSKVAAAYGALKPEGGIQRTVIILDRQGVVRYAKQGLPETEELLEQLDQLRRPESPPRRSGY
jgi:peroxiredoxin